MTQEIALRTNSGMVPVDKLTPTDHEMQVYAVMAEHAVSSKLYKNIGDKAAVMMIMLAARELGIPPMQALNKGIHLLPNGIEISARMMNAMIRRAGHSIKIISSTATGCTLTGKRADNGDTATVTYTLEEAAKAGLAKAGGNWYKHPVDMCFARAISRLARQLFSDVVGIGYVEGEISAIEAEVIPCRPKPEELEEMTQVDFEAVVTELDKTADLSEDYLALFSKEEAPLAGEYLNAVKNHFGISYNEAVKELLREPEKTIEKFNKWKVKK